MVEMRRNEELKYKKKKKLRVKNYNEFPQFGYCFGVVGTVNILNLNLFYYFGNMNWAREWFFIVLNGFFESVVNFWFKFVEIVLDMGWDFMVCEV